MNKVIQTVTIGKDDPKLVTSTNGKVYVTFQGAVNRRFVKEGDAPCDWFSYIAWGKTAEFIKNNFPARSTMIIVGEVNNNNYDKKNEDGTTTKVYGTRIAIDSVEFFGYKKDASVNGEATETPAETASTEAPAAETSAAETSSPAPASKDSEYMDF